MSEKQQTVCMAVWIPGRWSQSLWAWLVMAVTIRACLEGSQQPEEQSCSHKGQTGWSLTVRLFKQPHVPCWPKDKNVPQTKSCTPCYFSCSCLAGCPRGKGGWWGAHPVQLCSPVEQLMREQVLPSAQGECAGQSGAAPLQIRSSGGGCVKGGSTKIGILSALANLLKYFWGRWGPCSGFHSVANTMSWGNGEPRIARAEGTENYASGFP